MGKQFVVVDREEGKRYDTVIEHRYVGGFRSLFSPDSKHVGYVAKVEDKWFVVVDGEESKLYDSVYVVSTPWLGGQLFSADSKHVAYMAQAGNKWLVVVDGQEGRHYDAIDGFYELHEMEDRIGVGAITFDSPDSLHYIALRDNSIYVV